jgi:molybdopterin synthase catalytic subunit
MAIKELEKLCVQIRQKWDVLKIAIVHRVGEVPIGEASVIIVVSSAHRKESLEAVHWAIDELKATVPIWKREFYEDGHTSWKENSECCFVKKHDHVGHHEH